MFYLTIVNKTHVTWLARQYNELNTHFNVNILDRYKKQFSQPVDIFERFENICN